MSKPKPELSFRRKYPRRAFRRRVSVLVGGHYFLADGEEVGEGGMAFASDETIEEGAHVIVNFRIPGGDFVSLRGCVKSHVGQSGANIYGIAFENIAFSHKRQIRAYVSSRGLTEALLH